MDFLKRVRTFFTRVPLGVKLPPSYTYQNYGDGWGGGYMPFSGSNFNYRAEAGVPMENSIVAACVNWACRAWPEARPVVQRLDDLGNWVTEPSHPVYGLFAGQNSYMTTQMLWDNVVIGMLTSGNAYWFMHMDEYGVPNSLASIPWPFVQAEMNDSGTGWINHYIYSPPGVPPQNINPKQMVHFRYILDPTNIRFGMSPLVAVLREICADNESSTAAASMLRNKGLPGLLFTPSDDVARNMTQEQHRELQRLVDQRLTGEYRGKALISSLPGSWADFGCSPADMAFDVVRKMPEYRICSVYGISPMMLQLQAGLERATYANYEISRRASYENCMIPLWKNVAQQLTDQLLPYWESDLSRVRIWFDYTRVEALSENVSAMHKRLRDDYMAGIYTVNEVRMAFGALPVEGGDVLMTPTSMYEAERGEGTAPEEPPAPGRDNKENG